MVENRHPRTRLCERCYSPIEHDEQFLSLAHLDRALPDGSIEWRHAYVHTVTTCAEPVPAPRAHRGAVDRTEA
jgi:hypothetical protein